MNKPQGTHPETSPTRPSGSKTWRRSSENCDDPTWSWGAHPLVYRGGVWAPRPLIWQYKGRRRRGHDSVLPSGSSTTPAAPRPRPRWRLACLARTGAALGQGLIKHPCLLCLSLRETTVGGQHRRMVPAHASCTSLPW